MATEILLCENCGTWTLHTLVRSEPISGRAWKCESCSIVSGSGQTTIGSR